MSTTTHGIVLAAALYAISSAMVPSGLQGAGRNEEHPGLHIHQYADICPQSDIYEVMINGEQAFVYHATVASFASFECNDTVEVAITVHNAFLQLRILPLSLGITPEREGQTIRFRMTPAAKVYVESDLGEHLFLYGNHVDTDVPDPMDPSVRYFRAGQVYEAGEIRLGAGETLYVEGGAVIRGNIRATRANGCRIRGPGVLDGSYYGDDRRHQVHNLLVEDSRDVLIRDLIMVESRSWVITLYHSEDVSVENVKQISHGKGTDGVDIVSSRKIRVRNCILRNDDDCIVVKSFVQKYRRYSEVTQNTHFQGVEDVWVTGCAVQTNLGGQTFEIGHELLESPIQDIHIVDCDVLGAHQQSGVFGIHNADAALIRNIFFEDVRVDHYYNKLVDLRIIKSRFSSEEEAGRVENIYFKDISVTVSPYNPGYSISLIGGYDRDHKISNVQFENFRMKGKKITNADQMDLYIKQADGIVFK